MASNFIARETRLEIYTRDGFRCVYCSVTVSVGGTGATGPIASLDHVSARATGGALTDPKNLVTACCHCNSIKGTKTVPEFTRYLAAHYPGKLSVKNLVGKIRRQTSKEI